MTKDRNHALDHVVAVLFENRSLDNARPSLRVTCESSAVAEARARSQLPTYYAGLKGWLAVREHYQSKHGAASNLKAFHEAALKEGAVPLPVLDRLLQ
jgi:hypothetical protein